jgi:hypothetical protein
MEHDKQAIKDLMVYCRQLFYDNMNGFKLDYHPQLTIKGYTRECLTYKMLDRAFRLLEVDTIINMGFFIRDLHYQIQQLNERQLSWKTFYSLPGTRSDENRL